MDNLDKETYCFYSMCSWIFEYLEREFGIDKNITSITASPIFYFV